MTPQSGLIFGEPITVYGKTFIPVLMTMHLSGRHGRVISVKPCAVLFIEGETCWLAPLAGDCPEDTVEAALKSGNHTTGTGIAP
jgi:hypothetical protein